MYTKQAACRVRRRNKKDVMPNLFRHLTCLVYAMQANMQGVHQAGGLSRGMLKQVQHDVGACNPLLPAPAVTRAVAKQVE